MDMSLPTNTFYRFKSTTIIQNKWFTPFNCSIINVMGAVPKHSTFWDWSHVMMDQSRLYGTVTPKQVHIRLYPSAIWKNFRNQWVYCPDFLHVWHPVAFKYYYQYSSISKYYNILLWLTFPLSDRWILIITFGVPRISVSFEIISKL